MTRRVSLYAASARVSAGAALVGLLASCEALVGIHDSRSVAAGEGAGPATGSVAPGAQPEPRAGITSEGSPITGLSIPVGNEARPSPGGVSPGADAGRDGNSSQAPDAGSTPAGEPPGSVVDPVEEGPAPVDPAPVDPAPVDPAQCEITQPAALTLAGTAFLFTAGPNGGSPSGMGSCAYPNFELPAAPQLYGAVDPTLMGSRAALCGACMQLRFGGNSVEVTVIDVIEPNPLAHGSTLSIDAAAKRVLSATDQNLDVELTFVPCTTPDTIRLKFASAGDPSVLVFGHRTQLAAVQLSTPGISVPLVRQSYNYWTPPPGFSSNGDVVSLTLVDVAGNELSIPNVTSSASVVDTGRQFPAQECVVPAP